MDDGTRTRDNQNHNLALYQLNYIHHKENPIYRTHHPKVNEFLLRTDYNTELPGAIYSKQLHFFPMTLIIKVMKYILLCLLIVSFKSLASVVGISTHPLNDEARVLSAEMTGYMSQRHEVGMGLRYTQELDRGQLLDLVAGGAQESRGLFLGGGMDFEILREDVSQPRLSMKPYYQYQKMDNFKQYLIGAAPTMRKGFSVNGNEFFPYLAVPTGIKVDSSNEKFDYYASLTLGASLPLPAAGGDKLLLSFEGNKDLGASSDYLGVLVSWIWN